MGERDSVPAHIVELGRLSAGGRRRNRTEKETCEGITDGLKRTNSIPEKTKAAPDVQGIACGIDSHAEETERKQTQICPAQNRREILTVQLFPDDPEGSRAQNDQQQNTGPEGFLIPDFQNAALLSSDFGFTLCELYHSVRNMGRRRSKKY